MMPMVCDLCQRKFPGKARSVVSRHFKGNNNVDCSQPLLSCDVCLKTFLLAGNLASHLGTRHKTAFPWAVSTLACDDCSAAFTDRRNLALHQAGEHGLYRHIVEESHRRNALWRRNSLKSGACSAKSLQSGAGQCDECGESVSALIGHVQKYHRPRMTESEKKWSCDQCRKTFAIKSDLRRHLRCVHQSFGRLERVGCDDCAMSFTGMHNLPLHMNQSHKEKRYRCDACGCRFGFKVRLAAHLGLNYRAASKHRYVKAASDLCPAVRLPIKARFVCDQCGFTSTSTAARMYQFTQHFIRKHGLPKSPGY